MALHDTTLAPSLATMSGRFKIRPFPGQLSAHEWTFLVRLKYRRINVPDQVFWYSPSEEDRQVLQKSRQEFVEEFSSNESTPIPSSLKWLNVTKIWPAAAEAAHELDTRDRTNLRLYLGLYYDVVFCAINCAKVLMNFVDNRIKETLIAENEDCDLAWMLKRLLSVDLSAIPDHVREEGNIAGGESDEDEEGGKMSELMYDQYMYDREMLRVVKKFEGLTVHYNQTFLSLYESRFQIWAVCQYTMRRFYELTRKMTMVDYMPRDSTKYAMRFDLYKCRNVDCPFEIEVRPTGIVPTVVWRITKYKPHTCVVSSPSQDSLKLFREGQGMHLPRYFDYGVMSHDELVRLCWVTLKYSMHIMKRQHRRAMFCVNEHTSMFETPQSMASLATWLMAIDGENTVELTDPPQHIDNDTAGKDSHDDKDTADRDDKTGKPDVKRRRISENLGPG